MESTLSPLCPLLSAAGVPECSLNPSLTPLLLGLAALCALTYLSFVVYDIWPPTEGARRLLTEIGKDSLLLAGQFGLIALAWLVLLVPFDHIPFITGPVSGSFLIWTAPDAYGFAAGALHVLVTVLALQLALGLAFGQVLFVVRLAWRNLAERESKVYTNLVAIGAIVVVWYAVEVSQWPAPAAGWLELVVGLSAASLLAQSIVAPYLRPGAGSFRFQHLIFIVTGAGVIALIWQRHAPVFLESVGLISRRDNPALYPYVLIFFVIILAIWALGLLVRPGRNLPSGAYVNSLGGTLYSLFITLVSVYLLWLGLVTPLAQLPFPAPGSDLLGSAIPLLPVYTFFAVLAHALLAFAGALFVVAGITVGLLGLSTSGRLYNSLAVIAALAVVASWEWLSWPAWILVIVELLFAYGLPTSIIAFVRELRRGVQYDTPDRLRRARHLSRFADYGITLVFALIIVATHDMSAYLLGVISLYFCFTLLDSLVMLCHGIWDPKIADVKSLTPRRWLVTIPLIVLLALIGANASLPGWLGISTLTPDVWTDAAIAAIAFALFQPLLSFAELNHLMPRAEGFAETLGRYFSELSEQQTEALARVISEFSSRIRAQPEVPQPNVEPLATPSALPTPGSATTTLPVPFSSGLVRGRSAPARISEPVTLPASVFFITMALIFHAVFSTLDLDLPWTTT